MTGNCIPTDSMTSGERKSKPEEHNRIIMPTYGYICEQCGHRFEELQEIDTEQVRECPQCGGSTRRLIGRVGFVFKGSGFHTTDYDNTTPHTTCCGRTERCEKPPCSEDEICKR